MRKQFLILITSAFVLAGATGCSSKTDSTEDTVRIDTNATPTIQEHTGGMTQDKNVVDNIAAATDLSRMAEAIRQAELTITFGDEGPYTVFAPSDDAFAQVPTADMETLMERAKKPELTNLLTYHIVRGMVRAGDLRNGQELTTVQGQKLEVTIDDAKIKVNGASISKADVVSSNGVIHIIERVLMPK